jgi:hypothetical protein
MTTSTLLSSGIAERMGDGIMIVLQTDEAGTPQAVTLTERDLMAMLATI